MRKVLFIMGNMGLGGAETQIMKLFRAIDKNHFQFDFCVNVAEKNYYETEIVALGGKMIRTPIKGRKPFLYFRLLYTIIRNNYDVVVKCSENAASWVEMFVAFLAGCRIRIVRSTNTKVSNRPIIKLAHYLGRPLLRVFTTHYVAPSYEAGIWLFGKKAKNQIHIIKNAIPIEEYRFSSEIRHHMRRIMNIDTNFVIGTVGRLSLQKNHAFLIDVFKSYHEINKKAVLVIIGAGELKATLEAKILQEGLLDSVLLLGKRNDVPQLLMAMDLFCLPSLYEGMPNCVIEAEASGLPCVVSDTITRDCDVSKHVHFCSLNDKEAWVLGINEIELLCEDERVQCAETMRDSGYSIDDVVRIWSALFGSLDSEGKK